MSNQPIEVTIDPKNESFYVTLGGKPVARFTDHRKAGDFAVQMMIDREENK